MQPQLELIPVQSHEECLWNDVVGQAKLVFDIPVDLHVRDEVDDDLDGGQERLIRRAIWKRMSGIQRHVAADAAEADEEQDAASDDDEGSAKDENGRLKDEKTKDKEPKDETQESSLTEEELLQKIEELKTEKRKIFMMVALTASKTNKRKKKQKKKKSTRPIKTNDDTAMELDVAAIDNQDRHSNTPSPVPLSPSYLTRTTKSTAELDDEVSRPVSSPIPPSHDIKSSRSLTPISAAPSPVHLSPHRAELPAVPPPPTASSAYRSDRPYKFDRPYQSTYQQGHLGKRVRPDYESDYYPRKAIKPSFDDTAPREFMPERRGSAEGRRESISDRRESITERREFPGSSVSPRDASAPSSIPRREFPERREFTPSERPRFAYRPSRYGYTYRGTFRPAPGRPMPPPPAPGRPIPPHRDGPALRGGPVLRGRPSVRGIGRPVRPQMTGIVPRPRDVQPREFPPRDAPSRDLPSRDISTREQPPYRPKYGSATDNQGNGYPRPSHYGSERFTSESRTTDRFTPDTRTTDRFVPENRNSDRFNNDSRATDRFTSDSRPHFTDPRPPRRYSGESSSSSWRRPPPSKPLPPGSRFGYRDSYRPPSSSSSFDNSYKPSSLPPAPAPSQARR